MEANANATRTTRTTFFSVDVCAAREWCIWLINCHVGKDKRELKESSIKPKDNALDEVVKNKIGRMGEWEGKQENNDEKSIRKIILRTKKHRKRRY